MKKLRLKKGAIIGAYLIAFSLTGMGAFFVSQNMQVNNPTEEDIEYVNSSIIDDNERDKEVIKEEIKIIIVINLNTAPASLHHAFLELLIRLALHNPHDSKNDLQPIALPCRSKHFEIACSTY